MDDTTTIQLITFSLDGLSPEAYAEHTAQVAEAFAPGTIDGLRAKTWLADRAGNVYGGLYVWRDAHAQQAYVAGERFAALRANPHMTGVRSVVFGILEEPTRRTGGIGRWSFAPAGVPG
jgi:hypothetical protein